MRKVAQLWFDVLGFVTPINGPRPAIQAQTLSMFDTDRVSIVASGDDSYVGRWLRTTVKS